MNEIKSLFTQQSYDKLLEKLRSNSPTELLEGLDLLNLTFQYGTKQSLKTFPWLPTVNQLTNFLIQDFPQHYFTLILKSIFSSLEIAENLLNQFMSLGIFPNLQTLISKMTKSNEDQEVFENIIKVLTIIHNLNPEALYTNQGIDLIFSPFPKCNERNQNELVKLLSKLKIGKFHDLIYIFQKSLEISNLNQEAISPFLINIIDHMNESTFESLLNDLSKSFTSNILFINGKINLTSITAYFHLCKKCFDNPNFSSNIKNNPPLFICNILSEQEIIRNHSFLCEQALDFLDVFITSEKKEATNNNDPSNLQEGSKYKSQWNNPFSADYKSIAQFNRVLGGATKPYSSPFKQSIPPPSENTSKLSNTISTMNATIQSTPRNTKPSCQFDDELEHFLTSIRDSLIEFIKFGWRNQKKIQQAIQLFSILIQSYPVSLELDFMILLSYYICNPQIQQYISDIGVSLPHPIDADCAKWILLISIFSENASPAPLQKLVGPAYADTSINLTIKNVTDMVNFLTTLKKESFEINTIHNLTEIKSYLQIISTKPKDDDDKLTLERHKDDFQRLVYIIMNYLSIAPFNSEDYKDKYDISKPLPIEVQIGNMRATMDIDSESDFSCLEAFCNANYRSVEPSQLLIENQLNNDEFLDLIDLRKETTFTQTHVGTLLHQYINNYPNKSYTYKSLSFKIRTNDDINSYEFYDPILPSLLKHPSASVEVVEVHSSITKPYLLKELPSRIRSFLHQPPLPERCVLSLELLNQIHQLFYQDSLDYSHNFVEIVNDKSIRKEDHEFGQSLLSKKVLSQLGTIQSIHSHSNLSISIISLSPFLFPLSFRVLLFKAISFDMEKSREMYDEIVSQYISGVPADKSNQRGRKLSKYKISAQLKRGENLLDDGLKLLKTIGPGNLRFDIEFKGEIAVGFGPTREFFTLFSRELTRKSLRLWRPDDDLSNTTDYINSPLFPRPNADLELIELVGVFCAKSILMDMNAQFLNINPAFFDLVQQYLNSCLHFTKLNETLSVPIEKVDETLATSLLKKPKEGLFGLNFTYPGIDTLHLIPNGNFTEVTQINVDNYIRLVQHYTSGDHLLPIIQHFVLGFESVGRAAFLRLLYPEEISALICGQKVDITMEDLQNYVEFGSGYTKNSDQIVVLFSLIVNKFTDRERSLLLKFITGSGTLPCGGLKNLTPRLTISQRISEYNNDDSLPSAQTCTNHFKMPKYSNDSTMYNKIIQAITECQDSFSHS